MKISTEIYTSKVDECEFFYCTHLNFGVKYKTEGFVKLQHQTNPEYELMFCVPGSPFVHPVFHPEFNGMGVILQFDVDDVLGEYHRITEAGIRIVVELVQEEVNGYHFVIRDPGGLLIDIVQYDSQP